MEKKTCACGEKDHVVCWDGKATQPDPYCSCCRYTLEYMEERNDSPQR